jgi:hypothetical protein
MASIGSLLFNRKERKARKDFSLRSFDKDQRFAVQILINKSVIIVKGGEWVSSSKIELPHRQEYLGLNR